jgi:hypothetical protein
MQKPCAFGNWEDGPATYRATGPPFTARRNKEFKKARG